MSCYPDALNNRLQPCVMATRVTFPFPFLEIKLSVLRYSESFYQSVQSFAPIVFQIGRGSYTSSFVSVYCLVFVQIYNARQAGLLTSVAKKPIIKSIKQITTQSNICYFSKIKR